MTAVAADEAVRVWATGCISLVIDNGNARTRVPVAENTALASVVGAPLAICAVSLARDA